MLFFVIGKVYNDIGLVYSGLKFYENVVECFELVIFFMRIESINKELEVVF